MPGMTSRGVASGISLSSLFGNNRFIPIGFLLLCFLATNKRIKNCVPIITNDPPRRISQI